MTKQYSRVGKPTIKPFRYRADITQSINSMMPFREKFYYKIKETIRNKIILKGETDTQEKAQEIISAFMNKAN